MLSLKYFSYYADVRTMGMDTSLSIGIFLAGATLGTFVFSLFFVTPVRNLLLSRVGFGRGRFSRRAATDALSELHDEIEAFNQNLAVLDSYSVDYFNSFQEAGWHSLLRLGEDLSALESSLRVFLRTRRYREVCEVSLFLLDKLAVDGCQRIVQEHPVLSDLVGWRTRSRASLLQLIQIVATSAQRTKELGVARKRKPTLLSLAELRQTLER